MAFCERFVLKRFVFLCGQMKTEAFKSDHEICIAYSRFCLHFGRSSVDYTNRKLIIAIEVLRFHRWFKCCHDHLNFSFVWRNLIHSGVVAAELKGKRFGKNWEYGVRSCFLNFCHCLWQLSFKTFNSKMRDLKHVNSLWCPHIIQQRVIRIFKLIRKKLKSWSNTKFS